MLVGDAELISRFLRLKNEAAFAQIVNRYGAMVFAVALRLLKDRHSAEDVTQATFLLLAQNAKKIRRREALSCWLHGVAIRLARKALKRRSREKANNVLTDQEIADQSFEEIHTTFERQVLDEELQRLPVQYREPLILHFLQGQTYEQTAEQLGVTLGAIESRMKRAKRELQLRLTKRGVGLGTALAAIVCSQETSAAVLQPELFHTITTNGMAAFEGTAFTPSCSPEAVYLAGKEVTILTTTKIALITCGLAFAAGAGWIGHSRLADQGARPGTGAPSIETAVAQVDREAPENDGAILAQVRANRKKELSESSDPMRPAALDPLHEQIIGQLQIVSQRLAQRTAEVATAGSPTAPVFAEMKLLTAQLAALQAQLEASTAKTQPSTIPENGGIGYDMEFAPPRFSNMLPHAAIKIPVEKNDSPSYQKISAALEAPSPEMEFPGNPLVDVAQFLSLLLLIPIKIDETSLSDYGLSTDEEVALVLPAGATSTGEALHLMLEPLDLTYMIKNGVMFITTGEAASEHLETRVYDVRSLNITDPEALADVLLSTVGIDSWSDDGGFGELSYLNGSFIIRQSQNVHTEIEVLLNQLARQFQNNPTNIDWPIRERSLGGDGGWQGGYGGAEYDGGGVAPSGSGGGSGMKGSIVPKVPAPK